MPGEAQIASCYDGTPGRHMHPVSIRCTSCTSSYTVRLRAASSAPYEHRAGARTTCLLLKP
eukprot:scaffold1439_cov404-Prasinococcus_capsulatus_cf.AAC.28